MIIKCIQNKEIKTTRGKQTREFNYIDNIVDGILFLNKKINTELNQLILEIIKPISIKNLSKKNSQIHPIKIKIKNWITKI